MKSITERIRLIIDSARREQEQASIEQEKRVAASAEQLSRESQAGSAWLETHVMPALIELRRGLESQNVVVEIEVNLAQHSQHSPTQFSRASLTLRLLTKGQAGIVSSKYLSYVFHCDGEYLNISQQTGHENQPLGMPFKIDSNPEEAEEIVLEIIRRALVNYYQSF